MRKAMQCRSKLIGGVLCAMLAGNSLSATIATGVSSRVVLPKGGQSVQDQGNLKRVEVRVTAVQGVDFYLDQGQEAGLAIGDRVLLTPSLGPSISARIVSVTRTSSRARSDGAQAPDPETLEVGDEGVVLIPVERDPDTPGATVPHPPWSHEPLDWEQELPLLAPLTGRDPRTRERIFSGRTFVSYDRTRDQASVDSTYSALRSGFDGELENPFGRAGRLRLGVVYSGRDTDVEDGPGDSDSIVRLQRLSYRGGGLPGDPMQYEVGRFLHSEFPELGLIDGVETIWRTEGGARVGTSLGYLPEYDDKLGTGDDLALSIFGRWVASSEERLALGMAFQKSWHEGDADRDLVIGTFDWFATETLSLRTSAWVDLFNSEDDLEDDSASLTRLRATGTWRPSLGTGLSLFVSQLDRPQLLRDEFEPVEGTTFIDYEVTRVGGRAWMPLSETARLNVSIDQWKDEEASGLGGDVTLSVRDLLWDRGRFSASLRSREGRFSETTGLRLRATRSLRRGVLSLRYDAAIHDLSGNTDISEDVLQHTATTSYDCSLGNGWDLSVYLEGRFGDDQDSQTVGLFLQRAF